MIKLEHDLQKNYLIGNGSIVTHLNYLNRNFSMEEGALLLSATLNFKVRTKPRKYGARCAALIGVCYDDANILDNADRSLDMVISAINLNNS